jgi:hypothetical protein
MSRGFLQMLEDEAKEMQRDRADAVRLLRRYPHYDLIRVAGALPDRMSLPIQRLIPRAVSPTALEKAVLLEMSVGSSGEEWTSRKMVEAIRSGKGYRLPGHNASALNCVAIALATLTERGQIKRLHYGRGRSPHLYVLADAEKEAPVTETS